jgi:hypothetical protein
MIIHDFSTIKTSKKFENLALDLLEAEGFQLFFEPSQSGAGRHIIAKESIVSHSGYSHVLNWYVQCRYSNSKDYLSVGEIKQILEDFDKRADDGLLIIMDSDIDEDGLLILEEYLNGSQDSNHPTKSVVNRKHLIQLRQLMEQRFNESELRTLCFDLGVDYDCLTSVGKTDKIRELISYLERRSNIKHLIEVGKEFRPDISWEVEQDTSSNSSIRSDRKKSLIQIWDRRQLENRFMRHPAIAQKYGISKDTKSTSPFSQTGIEDKNILVISDTSSFSYQLFSGLNEVNANVQIITIWQYSDPLRCELILKDVLDAPHDLVILFLGDTFGFRLPIMIQKKLLKTAIDGKGIIFFPFFAWTLHQGTYEILNHLVPVKLADEPQLDQLWLKASRILASDDFSWLNAEAFIENQPVTVKVDNKHPILSNIESDFSIIHTFEFLNLKEGANCVLTDNLGTPFLVINEAVNAPIIYINSCTHNCLSKTHILSPFETSTQFQRMIANAVFWCLRLVS